MEGLYRIDRICQLLILITEFFKVSGPRITGPVRVKIVKYPDWATIFSKDSCSSSTETSSFLFDLNVPKGVTTSIYMRRVYRFLRICQPRPTGAGPVAWPAGGNESLGSTHNPLRCRVCGEGSA